MTEHIPEIIDDGPAVVWDDDIDPNFQPDAEEDQ